MDRVEICLKLTLGQNIDKSKDVISLIIGLAIYIILPVIGITTYLWVCSRMNKVQIVDPPFISWFLIFSAYGSWAIILLANICLKWSGLASLWVAFLIFFAPVILGCAAFRLRKKRNLSRFHLAAFYASCSYLLFLITLMLIFGSSW